MIDDSKNICKECGQKINVQYKFCINCGKSLLNLPDRKSTEGNLLLQLKTSLRKRIFLPKKRNKIPFKTKISLALFFAIITVLILIFLFPFITAIFQTTLNPERIIWNPLELPNQSLEKPSWAKIVKNSYAIEGNNLFFLIKWNGCIPASIQSNDVLEPRYLSYRKVYFSWIINEGTTFSLSKGELLIGDDNFFLFEFTVETPHFQLSTNMYPYMNETTVAFNVVHKRNVILNGSLSQISLTPAIEYVGYHKFQSNCQSLAEIAESPSNSIIIDGNISDWSNSSIKSTQMNGDPINGLNDTNEDFFPFFSNILTTRTTEGIYGAVSLNSTSFTEFIKDQGNLSVEIDWATIIAKISGNYEADYTFGVSLTFNQNEGYQIQEVYITLVAGTSNPTIFEEWQLPNNHSGTNACFEFLFPTNVISDLYSQTEETYFCTLMDIEWKEI